MTKKKDIDTRSLEFLLGEAARLANVILDSELAKGIPVVGTAIKLLRLEESPEECQRAIALSPGSARALRPYSSCPSKHRLSCPNSSHAPQPDIRHLTGHSIPAHERNGPSAPRSPCRLRGRRLH